MGLYQPLSIALIAAASFLCGKVSPGQKDTAESRKQLLIKKFEMIPGNDP